MALVVSFDTFVAIKFESAAETPYRESSLPGDPTLVSNFGAAWGSAAFLPLSGEESMSSVMNFASLPVPEMTMEENRTQTFAKSAEGGLPIIVPPGLLGGGTDPYSGFNIRDWVYTRYNGTGTTGVDANNQCRSATVWIRVGDFMKRFVGVKIGQADFQINKAQPLIINLNARAFGEEVVAVQSFSAPSWWSNAVYGGDYTRLRIGDDQITTPSATMTETANVDSTSFSINNMLDDDPHRLWDSPFPRRMYNRNREVTGSFEADLLSSSEYTRFLAQTLSAFEIRVSRKIGASTYQSTMLLPRIRYESVGGVVAAGQKSELRKQSPTFKALGGITGLDADANAIRWA